MQIDYLRFFIALEQYQSISKASRMMNTTPQNLNRILKKIEGEFTAPLFSCAADRIALTPNGFKFLEFAKNTVYQYDLLRSTINLSSDTLPDENIITVFSEGIINDAYLNDILIEFFNQYPYVNMKSVLTDYKIGYDKVEKLDDAFGVLIYDDLHAKDDAFLSKKEVLPIFKLHPVMIVSKNHPLAKKSMVALSDLEQQELVVFAKEALAYTESSMLLKKLRLTNSVSIKCLDNLKACYRTAASSTAICPGTLEAFQKLDIKLRETLVALPIMNYPVITYAFIKPKNLVENSVQALFCHFVLDYVQNNI